MLFVEGKVAHKSYSGFEGGLTGPVGWVLGKLGWSAPPELVILNSHDRALEDAYVCRTRAN